MAFILRFIALKMCTLSLVSVPVVTLLAGERPYIFDQCMRIFSIAGVRPFTFGHLLSVVVAEFLLFNNCECPRVCGH